MSRKIKQFQDLNRVCRNNSEQYYFPTPAHFQDEQYYFRYFPVDYTIIERHTVAARLQ